MPFRDLFAALTAGESHLLLPDGAYLSLERPELRRLRELITEARDLHDQDPERLRLRLIIKHKVSYFQYP